MAEVHVKLLNDMEAVLKSKDGRMIGALFFFSLLPIIIPTQRAVAQHRHPQFRPFQESFVKVAGTLLVP